MSETVTLPPAAELRQNCLEVAAKIAELRSIPATTRTDEQNQELRTFTSDLVSADVLARTAETAEKRTIEQAAWDHAVTVEAQRQANGPDAAFADTARPESRSIAALVVDNPAYQEWARTGSGVMPALEFDGRSIGAEYRTLLNGTVGTGPSYLQTVATPRPPVPREQSFFVRDLLSVVPTGLHAVPYVRELNPATTEAGASSVSEGGAKPEAAATFELDTAVIQKIAAWIPATTEILADAPTLQGYINQRLSYMVAFREQQQILTGNGVTPDLKGILTYTVQTAGTTNADPVTDIASALGKIENVDLTGNGIVMNPIDYWTTVALRHSTQLDGGGSGNAPFAGPPGTIWGLPVVRTRAMATLTALVGDFARGATLFDRMQTTVRQSDSHDTYFIYNKVAILAEERVGLAVDRPDAFVKTTIDITP